MTKPEQPSIDDAFDLLAKNTELPLGEYNTITQSQANIEKYLIQLLSSFSTVLYGDFSRKTMASPLSGNIVDMLVLLRESDIKNVDPTRVFKKLSGTLSKQYNDAYVVKNKNILMIPMKNFQFKVQPAYPIEADTYMVPSELFNEWVTYKTAAYNEILAKANAQHKGKLIEIIRIILTWNRVSGNIFNNYYLELLVTEILSSYEITSYSKTLRYIFRHALSEVAFQKLDPANIDFQVEGLNDIENIVVAMHLVKQSYTLADEAVKYEKDGNTKKALANWNKLLPQAFPTQVDMAVGKARSSGIKGADALRMMIKKTGLESN